ncbi:MAG: hypothetical protein GF307_04190 [candidate division Zixibacteria bacterium]|nr:hypothetical protein [candidate division Zixibacteria bacterium]
MLSGIAKIGSERCYLLRGYAPTCQELMMTVSGSEFGYRHIEDVATSDAAFEVKAGNINELFMFSGQALFSVMCDLDKVGHGQEIKIELESDNLEDLLYLYLSELLYLKDTEDMVFSAFDPKIDGNYSLSDAPLGMKIETLNEAPRVDIKAVTYYKYKVEKTDYGYYAFVVVDL